MFWDKGYTPSQNIEALLEKENATVEEFLDDDDILQECKTLKKSITTYFTRSDVIKRLVELITTEPPENLPMAHRFKYANMACEILTLGIPSLNEKILAETDILKILYSYLEKEPPLNPLLSSFFSKAFCMLFTKKSEQDWFLYQQMCLQLLEFLKVQGTFLDLICKHFSTPIIPDLLMQMMRDVEGGQLKRNLFEWLTEDKLVERLIDILRCSSETEKHVNVADFICDLIKQGRVMRQTEQENDSFEPAFTGSNPILKLIESECTVKSMLNVILEEGAEDSAIISGISVILTLVKPVVFGEEPNSDRSKYIQDHEKKSHEDIVDIVIQEIVPRLTDLNLLLTNPPKKSQIITTAATLSPPFGNTRLQALRLFTVLLQLQNETIKNAICETNFFQTILSLLQQYHWNNFLHSEVEKCIQTVFSIPKTEMGNSPRDLSSSKKSTDITKDYDATLSGNKFYDVFGPKEGSPESDKTSDDETGNNLNDAMEKDIKEINKSFNDECEDAENNKENEAKEDKENIEKVINENEGEKDTNVSENEDITKTNNEEVSVESETEIRPSALQKHVINNCKLMPQLVKLWDMNEQSQTSAKGRRLGYMGHLLKIFKHIISSISESKHIGALIEESLFDAADRSLWHKITDPNDGECIKALNLQKHKLANVSAQDSGNYNQHLHDFLADNSTWDYMSNMINNLGTTFTENSSTFGRNIGPDEEDDDEDGNGDGHSLFSNNRRSTSLLFPNCGQWGNLDPFSGNSNQGPTNSPWTTTEFGMDNFADFDSHFSSYYNDLGDSLISPPDTTKSEERNTNNDDFDRSVGANINTKKAKENNPVENNNANDDTENSTTILQSLKVSGDYIFNPAGEDCDVNNVDENNSNENLSTSIVMTLRSVIQDSDDDYEDDEGMWTRPLGDSSTNETDDPPSPINNVNDSFDNENNEDMSLVKSTVFTNGPSNIEKFMETDSVQNEDNSKDFEMRDASDENIEHDDNGAGDADDTKNHAKIHSFGLPLHNLSPETQEISILDTKLASAADESINEAEKFNSTATSAN